MPRRERCVAPGVAYHVTQRGIDQRDVFQGEVDRRCYLSLLKSNLPECRVGILAWCLMTNHVHLVLVPEREDSLAVLLRRVHGRYAQYHNVRLERLGHLWQNRYYACALSDVHLWRALVYVERNPVRAGMVMRAQDYAWSSARAHVTGADDTGLLDMGWWRSQGAGAGWLEVLSGEDAASSRDLEDCTYAGRPYGDAGFLEQMGEQFGRTWKRGRPKVKGAQEGAGAGVARQSVLP